MRRSQRIPAGWACLPATRCARWQTYDCQLSPQHSYTARDTSGNTSTATGNKRSRQTSGRRRTGSKRSSLHDRGSVIESDVDDVRQKCVFTTHTPVDAGHDRFSAELVESVLGKERTGILARLTHPEAGVFNLTKLAMFFCRSANGVSIRHAHVARRMFPETSISAITNGVHVGTWTSPPFARLYDRHVPDWRRDNRYLRQASAIPREDIQMAHAETKATLLAEVERRTSTKLNAGTMTIGFARRATGYKRADLLYTDEERLRRIIERVGPLQLVYGGKAHSRDTTGKAAIER